MATSAANQWIPSSAGSTAEYVGYSLFMDTMTER
jgi:hypothetical protein